MSSEFFKEVETKLNHSEERINELKDQHIHNFYVQSPIPTLIANETGAYFLAKISVSNI